MKRRISWMRNWLGMTLLLGLGAGCGGITATKSVSPLDFLLPGLLKVDPPERMLPQATNTVVCWRN